MVPFGYNMQVNYFFKDAMIGKVFYQSNRFVYTFKDSSGRVRVTVRHYVRDLYPVPAFKLFPDVRFAGTGKTESDVLAEAIRRGALDKPLCSYEVRAYAIQGWLLNAPSVTRRDETGKPVEGQYDPNQDNFAQQMGTDGQVHWGPSTMVTNRWDFDYVTPSGLEQESVNLGRLLSVDLQPKDFAQVTGMEYTVSGKILSANEVSQQGSGIKFWGKTSDFTLPDLKAVNTEPNPVQKLTLRTPLW